MEHLGMKINGASELTHTWNHFGSPRCFFAEEPKLAAPAASRFRQKGFVEVTDDATNGDIMVDNGDIMLNSWLL
jgi:hypothetical protein